MKVKGKHEFEATPSVNGNAIALANQVSAVDHAHGNIANDGKVGSSANLPLITGTDGIVTAGSFGTDANSFCQGNDARLSDARTPTAHNHDASDVDSGTLDGARIPTLDAAKIGSGVLDIARIPAAAIERMVPVADQTARFSLTTNEVQLGDTVKQLDTGIMYVVIDTANLTNAAGYSEYTAATAAAVPWSGVQSKPTTLSGYGITDAATGTHIHGNISNAGAIGSTAGLPIVTSTSGIVAAGSWYASTPAAPTTTGGTGSSTSPARGDHAHPSRIATSAPASPVNGDIWMV